MSSISLSILVYAQARKLKEFVTYQNLKNDENDENFFVTEITF